MYFPDLIAEYKQSLKDLRAVGGCPSMERDLQEAIKWMETGYDPAEYRAATRQDAIVMDHHLMQDLIMYVDSTDGMPAHLRRVESIIFNEHDPDSYKKWVGRELYNEGNRMHEIKEQINSALRGLTKNERTVFVMIRAERMTFGKVARILGLTKSTVQTQLQRAESKIKKNISSGNTCLSYDYLYSKERFFA